MEQKENDEKRKIESVIFVQHTEFSKLAKRMRERLENFEKLGTIKIKIVERAGEKLVDALHKSNAWNEMDCNRPDCLICKTEGSKKGSCRRRNVLYETFCKTCEDIEKEIVEKEIPNPLEGKIEENIQKEKEVHSNNRSTGSKTKGSQNLSSTGCPKKSVIGKEGLAKTCSV